MMAEITGRSEKWRPAVRIPSVTRYGGLVAGCQSDSHAVVSVEFKIKHSKVVIAVFALA